MSEEKIREAIRRQLREQFGVSREGKESGEGRAYRPHGTQHDAKLEKEIPRNDEKNRDD